VYDMIIRPILLRGSSVSQLKDKGLITDVSKDQDDRWMFNYTIGYDLE